MSFTLSSMPTSKGQRVVAVIVEVLRGFRLAHAMTVDQRLLGIRPATPGVEFDDLHVGDQVELDVEEPFARVKWARVVHRAVPSTPPQ